MRILVTGHTGYIGSVLCPFLQAAGHSVAGLDSKLFADCILGPPPATVPGVAADFRSTGLSDLVGFDAVIHLASLCNDPLSDLNPTLTEEINFEASWRLARLAKAAGVQRFLLSSSCSIYGASGDDLVSEEAPLAPLTAYARAKINLERALSCLADDSFSPVFLRNATAYGWSPRPRLDLVLNNLVASAMTTGRVLLRSDGTPWRPLVHVEDISRAFLAALEAPRATVHNQSLNVGVATHNFQMGEVAEVVAAVVPGSRVEYAADAGPDLRCYRVDFSKISSVLPTYRPEWNLHRGAMEMYDHFLNNGLTRKMAEGPKYKRLNWICELKKRGLLDESLRWIPRSVAVSSAR